MTIPHGWKVDRKSPEGRTEILEYTRINFLLSKPRALGKDDLMLTREENELHEKGKGPPSTVALASKVYEEEKKA